MKSLIRKRFFSSTVLHCLYRFITNVFLIFTQLTKLYVIDLDGNGVWDQDEVKALFLKELDKLYVQGAPQNDLLKRAEEMERMREHVFNEADLNKDGLIRYI